MNGQKCPEIGPDPHLGPADFKPDAERYPYAACVHPLLEVVQNPGEIIIFPANYFHQTYHYGPTVAIASQMMSEGCKARVLGQIMDYSGRGQSMLPPNFWIKSTQEQVEFVLGEALEKLWPGNGHAYLKRMLPSASGNDQGRIRKTALLEGDITIHDESLERNLLRIACGMLDVPPWEAPGLPVCWAMPLAQQSW